MSSVGSREIEGARKRLAAAKTQVSTAKMMMEQAKAMLNSAQTLSDTADKEFNEAQTALEEAEKRWEVIDIDMDDTNGASMDNIGNDEQRKVSPAPGDGASDTNLQNKLTPNAIATMYQMDSSTEDTSFTPILQVIHLQKIQNVTNDVDERFELILSDGQHFISSICTIGLNHLINNGTIAKHSFLRITEFVINTTGIAGSSTAICIILGAKMGGNPGSRIGAPIDISKVPINQVVVEECGIPEFDGNYRKSDVMYQSAPVYCKVGQWKGEEVTFAIFMPSFHTYNWHIGIWKGDIDSGEGPDSWCYSSFYDSRYDAPPSCVVPPEKDWEVVGNGINPAPYIRLMRGGN